MNIHTIVKALVNKIQRYKCKITIILAIAFEHQNFRMRVLVNTHPLPLRLWIHSHNKSLCFPRLHVKSWRKLVFIPEEWKTSFYSCTHIVWRKPTAMNLQTFGIYLDDFIFPVLLLFSLCISESKITSKPFSWYTNFNRT